MTKELTKEEYSKLKDNITGIIAYSGSNPCIAERKIMELLIDKGIIVVESTKEKNNE